jgi:SAM-dependent methyltransferase
LINPLKRYAVEGLHEKVLKCMEELPKGLVLDAPSGQGALSEDLEKIGFKVVSGDIERENILYRNSRCVQLDLNHFLPFKQAAFDYLVCTEGIEHIENPQHLIREFSRLVERGGFLILTTPNVMTIKSRLRFLFYSYLDYFKFFGPLPPEARYRIEEHEHQHVNPLFYAEMKFILEKYGFKIERVETNRMVRKWKLIFPLIKWFVKYKTKKKFPMDPLYLSDIILEGEDLIFVTKKKSG